MPDWMDSERFDIEAKPEGEPRSVTVDEMRLMVQSLLEERFQLKVHRESQEMSVYTLAVGNGEPKFKPSSDPAQAIPVPSAPFGEPRTVQSPFGPIGGGLTSPPMPLGGLIMAHGHRRRHGGLEQLDDDVLNRHIPTVGMELAP